MDAADDLQIHRLDQRLARVARSMGLGKLARDEASRPRWFYSRNEHKLATAEYERRLATADERRRADKKKRRRAKREAIVTLADPAPPPRRPPRALPPPPPKRSRVPIDKRPRDPLDVIEDSLFRVALLLTEAAQEVHKHAQYMRAARMEWEQAEREQAALDEEREREYARLVRGVEGDERVEAQHHEDDQGAGEEPSR